MIKTYLCVENGEKFTIKANSMEHAKQLVVVWNAEVIQELTPEKDESNTK